MMGKRKEKKTLEKRREKEETDQLVALKQTYTEQVDSRFADIDAVADPAEKILELHKLQNEMHEAAVDHLLTWERIVYRRTRQATHGIHAWRLLTPSGVDNKRMEIKTPMVVQHGHPFHFMESQKSRASQMLDEIQRTCSLKEVCNSPLLPDDASLDKFLDNHAPLRDRFEIVAFKAAVAALKENPPVPPASSPQPNP